MTDKQYDRIMDIPIKKLKINNMLYIGHRKEKNHTFKPYQWSQYFFDNKWDIFIGIPNLRYTTEEELINFLNINKEKFIESYILFFSEPIKKDIIIEDYYLQNMQPLKNNILNFILKSKFNKLGKYHIKYMILSGSMENWVRVITI